MIDDQAKETIPIYARAQPAFQKKYLPPSSENINDLGITLTSVTLDMPSLFKIIIPIAKSRSARPSRQDHVVFYMKSRWKPNLPALSDVKILLQNQLLIISNRQQSCWRVERRCEVPTQNQYRVLYMLGFHARSNVRCGW